jgi:3-hydroxyisobutyrate dehydrogenase-like beta-hydroxyacid dehydrogenase
MALSKASEAPMIEDAANNMEALPHQATIILCSTVPASFLESTRERLAVLARQDINIVDSPVSGGSVRAGEGSLTILSSGSLEAMASSKKVLDDMSATLHVIPGGISAASKIKMINQLLAGIHIAAAAEAMGLAAKMGLNTRTVFDVIRNAAGNSWMFENRVPHMLENDWTPHSALDIFVKDMVRKSYRLKFID